MRTSLLAAVLAAPLALTACQPGAPIITPVPLPVTQEPPEVQQACQVLSWAVPAASVFIDLSPTVRMWIDRAQPALASCAAGNANQSIIDIALALQDLLMKRGVRPPVGVVLYRKAGGG